MNLIIFCNTFKLRETPKALTTIFIWKLIKRTRLITEPNGKKVKDNTMGNPHPSS